MYEDFGAYHITEKNLKDMIAAFPDVEYPLYTPDLLATRLKSESLSEYMRNIHREVKEGKIKPIAQPDTSDDADGGDYFHMDLEDYDPSMHDYTGHPLADS